MANDFYTPTGSPATASSGSSAVVRAEFDALRAAFDKMMGLAGNGGLPAFVNAGGTALEAANIATAQSRLGIVVSNELNGLANLNAVGIIARTGNGTFSSRTLTAPAAGIAVANGNGVSGNPTLSLANDLNALEALNNNGIAVRTGDDTWTARTIVGTANQVSVANGNGVAGNQTLSLPNPLNITDLGLTNLNATGTLAVAGNASLNNLNATTFGAGNISATGNVTGANMNVTGALRGTSAMMSPVNNSLAANVNLNNSSVFFDGPSVAQGNNGTWFVSGKVTVFDSSTSSDFYAKLWDGTTVIDAGESQVIAVNDQITIALSGFISSPAGNLKISVQNPSGVTGKISANFLGHNNINRASTITAFRIG